MADDAGRWLVETEWLASHLDTPDLVVLDGSMHLPTAKRDARAEYLAEHIPGAVFVDNLPDFAEHAAAKAYRQLACELVDRGALA